MSPIRSPIRSAISSAIRSAFSAGSGGAAAPSIYVDSVSGSDANSGATEALPKQTLASARTAVLALGNGTNLWLKAGSVWRESLDLSTLTGVKVEAYGSGAAPVVTGFEIQTGWIQDGTLTNLWYKDVAHNDNGSKRQVVIADNALMNRAASASTANSQAGAYFCEAAGVANPTRVYIHPNGTNPNSNGVTYEVTTRALCIYLGLQATVIGIVARGAISNNGPLETGKNSTVRRCVAAFGTKHNALVPSGLVEDVVFADADTGTVTEPGVIPIVFFAVNQDGLSATLRRGMFYNNRTITEFIYSHSLNDPADGLDNVLIEQCVGFISSTGGGAAVAGAATSTYTARNCSFNGKITGLVKAYAGSLVIERVYGETTADTGSFGNLTTPGSMSISHCGANNTVSGGGASVITGLAGQSVSLSCCTLLMTSVNYANALGVQTNIAVTNSHNNCVVVANNAINKQTNGTLGATNNNVYVTPPSGGIGPFATWNGSFSNLTTAMAAWRTASGQDANSIALTVSPMTGTVADGDFRAGASALGNGATEHWNFNTRSVVATAQTRWPVGPRTYSEALAYIADPAAWNFYP